MNDFHSTWRTPLLGLVLGLAAMHSSGQTVDYIVAVVNQELVTSSEVQSRVARYREEAARAKQQLPPEAELRKQALDSLIEERVLITNARDSSARVAARSFHSTQLCTCRAVAHHHWGHGAGFDALLTKQT